MPSAAAELAQIAKMLDWLKLACHLTGTRRRGKRRLATNRLGHQRHQYVCVYVYRYPTTPHAPRVEEEKGLVREVSRNNKYYFESLTRWQTLSGLLQQN